MSLEFTISSGIVPLISIQKTIERVSKESLITAYELQFVKSGKTFNVTIKTNYETYIFLQKINSKPQYEIWAEQYLDEYKKKFSIEYYDTSRIFMDFIGSIRHGTYTNMVCIIDLYRNVKKTNIESSTTDLLTRFFSFLKEPNEFLWKFYISTYIFYSLFQEKMVKAISFLYSKRAFKKADGILLAFLNLSKSKINRDIDSSVKFIYENSLKFRDEYLLKAKKAELHSFTLCSFRICPNFPNQVPYKHIYSFL